MQRRGRERVEPRRDSELGAEMGAEMGAVRVAWLEGLEVDVDVNGSVSICTHKFTTI